MKLHETARLIGALALFLAACTPTSAAATPTPAATAPPILPSTIEQPTATPLPTIVTVWLPPILAPDGSTPAGALMAERLHSFEAAHPNVRLAVRTKELSGPSGLLETLRAASVVAPASLPQLIALGAGELTTAAEEELIVPYPGPLPPPAEGEWYDFALRSAAVGDVVYGVPSAAQTDVLVFDAAAYGRSPSDWSGIVGGPAPFLFPAADAQALFTLAEYLAGGAELAQPDGRPAIDPGALEEVLTFYGSAYSAGVLPLTSRQYDSSAATAALFEEHRAASAVAPLEHWMLAPRPGSAAAALPSRDGSGAALGRTWSWAVVTEDEVLVPTVVELVEWLSDPEFLGAWTYALGTLPPNAAALHVWPAGAATTLVNQLVRVAQPMPPERIALVVGPPLRKAVDAVLSGALTPQTAALQASTEVAGP